MVDRPFKVNTNRRGCLGSIFLIETIDILRGTLVFNQRPGPATFTIAYKPGTPISDNLRKLEYDFGQQKAEHKPTRAQAEKMLNQAIAKAEEQKNELVAFAPPTGLEWGAGLAWVFGALFVISSIALLIQRKTR